LGVVKQSTANPLELGQTVRRELPGISAQLPTGMKVQIAYDSSKFIERSVESVFVTIFEAIALVILVIFLFLRSGRATLIPLVTIPVSLIGAFAMMYAFGYSINTLTLLAMVLAIGLVVDDAIVMLENIHRHVEHGMNAVEAAFKGSREIAFAVLAMTFTLAAVFAPMGFSTGRTGKLFTEFALTLAGAVIVSGFVALTLSPMMASKLLHYEKKHNAFYNFGEKLLQNLNHGYRRLLGLALNSKALIIIMVIAVGAGAVVVFTQLQSELAPVEDRGTILAIGIAPEGSTPEYTDRYARQMEAIVQTAPEVENYFTIVGFPTVTQALQFMLLKDWADRDRMQQQVTSELAGQLYGGIPGVLAFAMNPPSLGQSPIDKAVEIVIQSSGSYDELEQLVGKLMEKARANSSLVGLDVDLKLNKPQIKVIVNRDKIAAVGTDVETVGRTLETLLGGREVTRFKRGTEQYDVIVQVVEADRKQPTDINHIYVRGSDGQMVQLSNLVDIRETVAPKELNHFGKLRAATISANLAPGYSLGEALDFLETTLNEIAPVGTRLDYKGMSREFKESGQSMYVIFAMALCFIYLVLAAQFESFIDPFIILLSVPLALAGALATTYITGGSMNIYTQIGMITLVGLITKHGILIVEFANQLQQQGNIKIDAVIEASVLRLRPILMTTGAMILGAVPLAIATGAGAEGREAIGWVIVGGMGFGTLLTLFVVPVVYLLLGADHHKAANSEPLTTA
ncbi:MAG: efflux RND transporter permease subunit, partial [Gammaproteobacteria bacterium]